MSDREMIGCEQAVERVYEFLDGELDAELMERVREHIEVCKRCYPYFNFERIFLDHIRSKLDLEPHETTDDGKFTLLTLECLGSCDTAPVALINDELHESLTIETLDQILENLPD